MKVPQSPAAVSPEQHTNAQAAATPVQFAGCTIPYNPAATQSPASLPANSVSPQRAAARGSLGSPKMHQQLLQEHEQQLSAFRKGVESIHNGDPWLPAATAEPHSESRGKSSFTVLTVCCCDSSHHTAARTRGAVTNQRAPSKQPQHSWTGAVWPIASGGGLPRAAGQHRGQHRG